MDALHAIEFWLSAGLTLALGLRARSLGLVRVAGSTIASAALQYVSIAVLLVLQPERSTAWFALSCWALAASHACCAAFFASRAPASEFEIAARATNLSRGLLSIGLLDAALAAATQADGLLQFALLVLLWWLSALVIFFCALRMQRAHRAREAFSSASRARILTWHAGLTVLAPGSIFIGSFAGRGLMLVALLLPLVTPILTATLTGAGPIPFELRSLGEIPTPSQWRRVGLPIIAVFALAFTLAEYGRHFGRCGGTLETSETPPDWALLRPIAEGSTESIGPFKFRARHFNYKGYPSAYEDAALSDPKLCFASTISLASWFGGDMYKSPSELHLRHDAPRGIYIVSASHWQEGEQLIAAFRRNPTSRAAFDSELSKHFLVGSSGLLIVALALTGLSRLSARKQRSDSERTYRIAAYVLFAASAATNLALEERWLSNGEPRPGREFAEEYPWIM